MGTGHMVKTGTVVGRSGAGKYAIATCLGKRRFESLQSVFDMTYDLRILGFRLFGYRCPCGGGTHYHLTRKPTKRWPPKGVKNDPAYHRMRREALVRSGEGLLPAADPLMQSVLEHLRHSLD